MFLDRESANRTISAARLSLLVPSGFSINPNDLDAIGPLYSYPARYKEAEAVTT